MKFPPKDFFTYEDYQAAADFIRGRTAHQPEIGLILGSGLSPLANDIEAADIIPYQEIPNFPHSGVVGHAGQLVIGRLAGHPLITMQGRSHFYEGYSQQQITFPVRVMHLLGVKTLIVTNAAGGINTGFQAGDLMLIVDHLNFVGISGQNPLRGPNLDEFGVRFPGMAQAYSATLGGLARQAAQELDLALREGVYAYVAGPSFETPAEIRFLSAVGADAVGMSTVPEVIVANHCGMEVIGLSSITNITIRELQSGLETSHEEVLETGKKIVPQLIQLLKEILKKIE
ncbi:MAG: purine-nucleoside phosphorylase [Anaerolineae bacterium]|nr:purine-nucleoside phosphorylase [Anaerolineae bacterium]